MVPRPRKTKSKAHVPDIRKLTESIRRNARQMVLKQVLEFARRERNMFVERINKQDFESFDEVPLNPEYKQHKIDKHLDPRTMIRTKHYINHIDVFQEMRKRKIIVRIGFPKGMKAVKEDGSEAKITLAKLAAVHEHGSEKANIPARPHWGPHRRDMMARAQKLRKTVAEALVRMVRILTKRKHKP